jgi:hypothetical protein
MFHWREEAGEIKQGFNFYYPNSTHSIGGFLRIGNHIVRIRWSKNIKRFFVGYNKIDPLEYKRLRDNFKI